MSNKTESKEVLDEALDSLQHIADTDSEIPLGSDCAKALLKERTRLRNFAIYVRANTLNGCANYSGISLAALAADALGEKHNRGTDR